MSKKKKQYDDDDGRTVANMNVDGMPWYLERANKSSGNNDSGMNMSKSEERAMLRGVILATLAVTGVFVLGGLLFVLFCTNIWFK